MDDDHDAIRLPYRGWEIRSHLTHVSLEGTVAAGAEVFLGDICRCHIVSSRQFAVGRDAIGAIEIRAASWIDDHETAQSPQTQEPNDAEPALLS